MPEFNFDVFQQELETQRQVTAARQEEQLATEAQQQRISERSSQLGREYESAAQPVRRGLMERRQKAEHARQLTDTGGIFGALRVMGLEMLDPGGYSREERQARTAEDVQYLSALGQTYNISQDALRLELMSSAGNLNRLKLLESIGQEKLKQFSEEAALLKGNLESNEIYQSAATKDMTIDQLAAAAESAKQAGGETNVNGVTVSQRLLEDRLEALRQREFELKRNQAVRDAGQIAIDQKDLEKQNELNRRQTGDALSNWDKDQMIRDAERIRGLDSASRLPHEIAMRDRNQRLQENQIAGTDHDLKVMDYNRTQETQTMLREGQRRVLNTMNIEELGELSKNGNKLGVEQFVTEDVNAELERKRAARTGRITQGMEDLALQNFNATTVRNEATRVSEIEQRFSATSPMRTVIDQYKAALGIFSTQANSPDIAQKMVGAAALEQMKAKFEAQLDAEATRVAAGDKDKERLLQEFYRGRPIPQEVLRDSIQKKLIANQSPSDFIPPEIAVKMERVYREEYGTLMRAGAWQGDKPDKKIAQAEAAQKAIDWAVNQSLTGRVESILSMQVTHPDHPLRAKGWTPARMATTIKVADDTAFQQWSRQNDLSPEEAEAIRSFKDVEGKDNENLRSQLSYMQNAMLIESFNGVEPGLGKKFVDWWESRGENYLQIEAETYDNSLRSGSFESNALRTLGRQQEQINMRGYAVGLIDSEGSLRESEVQNRANFLSFGGNPSHLQAVVLDYNDDLQSQEKEIVWEKYMLPLINEAARRGFNYDETNRFIENQIIGGRDPADKEVARLVKVLKRNRSANVETASKFIRAATGFDRARSLGMNLPRGQYPSVQNRASSIDWYDRVNARQPVAPSKP